MKHLLIVPFLLCSFYIWSQPSDSLSTKLDRYHYLQTAIRNSDNSQNSCSRRLKTQEEAIRLANSIYGEQHLEYALANFNLAKVYFSCISSDTAIHFVNKNLEAFKNQAPKKAPIVPLLLSYKGYLLMKTGDYNDALVLGKQAVEIAGVHFSEEIQIQTICLNNLARILDKGGKPREALPLLIQSKNLFHYPIDTNLQHLFYHQLLPTLGTVYHNLGQYEKALPVYLEALKGCRHFKNDKPLGQRLFQVGKLYHAMGQYQKAQSALEQGAAIIKRNEGEYSGWYGLVTHALGKVYYKTHNYTQALACFQIAHRNYVNDYAPDHPFCSIFLSKIGATYRQMGQFDHARINLEKGCEIAEKSFGKHHPEYAARLYDLAVLFRSMKQQDKALDYIKQALGIAQTTLPGNHPTIGIYYNELAINLENRHLIPQTQNAFLAANTNALNRVLWQFASFSGAEQAALLKTLNRFFAQYQSFVYRYPENTALAEAAYDDVLAFKGRILGNQKALVDYFRRQTSPAFYQKYEEWQELQQIIARQSSLPLGSRLSDFEKIQARYNHLESELARYSASFRENHGDVHWKMVQQALQTDEVAIEFTHFDYYRPGTDTPSGQVRYMAYLIRKDLPKPLVIPLFEENEVGSLNAISKLYRYQEKSLSPPLHQFIWQKLEPHISDAKAIHFAPSGILHRINFGAIPIDAQTNISDRFALHQLISTRQLFSSTPEKKANQDLAVLYGGINYSANGRLAALQNDFSAWPFLPWTEKEVDDLAQTLEANFSRTKVFTKSEATEEVFKSMGTEQNAPYLIHLATHGYFFPPQSAQTNLDSSTDLPFLTSNDPMIRSGLILAQANHVWQGGTVHDGIEDGILTAYEVAQLDLSQTELVVLSACDTGLGDIRDNEGVYGLQRAFKLAGAKYLLMSLWNVNDVQSYQFMTTFYQQWVNVGQTIPNAFYETQRMMRAKYPHHPAAWAGFVLVK